ncbi:MAG: hypothetical protein IKF38_05000 [Clostridia bacterium]|nr:hypothetical protein [Clostridia bacterium]
MPATNIFTKIMDLIEKETDIPLLEKDLLNWLAEKPRNQAIYEIYKKSSKSREL